MMSELSFYSWYIDMNIVFQNVLSHQLAKQLAEFLKILSLLKIQFACRMTFLCLLSRSIQMNHS